MRLKTLATILLAAFVAVAVGFIVVRTPSPPPGEPTPAVGATPPTAFRDTPPEQTERAQPPGGKSVLAEVAALPSSERGAKSPAVIPDRGFERDESVPPPALVRKVIATYFHGNVRCATCRKVETYAREAVEEGFRSEVAAGVVEFRAVNVDVAANAHFIEDFKLTNKSVIVTEEVDGEVARWAKLDEVWSFVGNRDAYFVYVQDAVRGYLEPQ